MRSTIAAISALALGVAAQECMSPTDAATVAGNFRALIAEPFSVPNAELWMTTDYADYTDSVIELIDGGCANNPIPLGTATFPNRAAFIAGQSQQPPIDFNIIKVWNNCDTVFMRWYSSLPAPHTPIEQVTGNIILEAVYNGTQPQAPWQIQTSYSEFNSGAWLYDLGNFTPTCPPPPPGSKRSVELL